MKISLLDVQRTEFLGIHQQPIKDMKCSPRFDGLVLSTSLDKTLKVTSLATGTVQHSFQLESGGWSCSWDPLDPFCMAVGLQNSSIVFFDIRNTSTFVKKIKNGKKPLPIHSIAPVHQQEGASFNPSGWLIGTPENVFFWNSSDRFNYVCHPFADNLLPGSLYFRKTIIFFNFFF